MTILPLHYLPNIRYCTKLLAAGGDAAIDIHEHWIKQSYRTRCDILCANGVIALSVPVRKPHNEKIAVKDVRIDNSKAWQHQHWMSLVSAYKNAPYFDHYAPRFERFFRERQTFLTDLNLELLQQAMKCLGIRTPLRLSEGYIAAADTDADYRSAISPKQRLNAGDNAFNPAPYYQVFSEKFPFAPNLSVFDLLMCEGPAAIDTVKRSGAGL